MGGLLLQWWACFVNVACGRVHSKTFTCIHTCTYVFFFNSFIFLDFMGFQPNSECTLQLNHKIINESDKSMTTVQTAILLFKNNFFECETGRPVHFTNDMLSISQLICKSLGKESCPLLTSAL